MPLPLLGSFPLPPVPSLVFSEETALGEEAAGREGATQGALGWRGAAAEGARTGGGGVQGMDLAPPTCFRDLAQAGALSI